MAHTENRHKGLRQDHSRVVGPILLRNHLFTKLNSIQNFLELGVYDGTLLG